MLLHKRDHAVSIIFVVIVIGKTPSPKVFVFFSAALVAQNELSSSTSACFDHALLIQLSQIRLCSSEVVGK